MLFLGIRKQLEYLAGDMMRIAERYYCIGRSEDLHWDFAGAKSGRGAQGPAV